MECKPKPGLAQVIKVAVSIFSLQLIHMGWINWLFMLEKKILGFHTGCNIYTQNYWSLITSYLHIWLVPSSSNLLVGLDVSITWTFTLVCIAGLTIVCIDLHISILITRLIVTLALRSWTYLYVLLNVGVPTTLWRSHRWFGWWWSTIACLRLWWLWRLALFWGRLIIRG